jgi:uncharacterized repeat protein (TIGR01451 family)
MAIGEKGALMRRVGLAFQSTWWRIALASTTLLLGPAAGSASAQENGQVFVANFFGDSVTMYSLSTTGDKPPAAVIAGLPAFPHQIAINHRRSELIVANNGASKVSVYDRVTGTLKRTIEGSGIHLPAGVAIDETRGELYVANLGSPASISVYDDLSSGNVSPKRTITSPAMLGPVGLAVDVVHNEILVSDFIFNSILTFDRLARDPSEPKRQISGAGLHLPQGIALDLSHDEILVAKSEFPAPDAGAILVFNRTDDGFLSAPLRKLEGSSTKLCNPYSVAVDFLRDEIIVANANWGQGTCAQSVTAYQRTADGDVGPKRMIAGGSTMLNTPTSAAIFYGASLNVANKAASANVAVGSAITYTVTATASGGTVLDARVTDTLPSTGGLIWTLSGTNAADCTLVNNHLDCSFKTLLKGQSKSVKVSAPTFQANCSVPVSSQATFSYNNGDAFLSGASPVSTVTVKCR